MPSQPCLLKSSFRRSAAPFFLTAWVLVQVLGLDAVALEVSVVTTEAELVYSHIEGYDLLELDAEKCALEGEPGAPWLPVRNVHVLLPNGAKAGSVAVTAIDEVPLKGTHLICPAQPPVRVSDPGPHPFVEPDPGVYASASGVRPEVAKLIDTVIIRGYHVAVVQVYPVDYIPAKGALRLRRRIDLTVEMVTDKAFNAEKAFYPSESPSFTSMVAADVVNPEAMMSGGYERPLGLTPEDDIKYLLIADGSMLDEFQPLLDWKTKKGVPAVAVTLEWIYANFDGADQQEQIKACIREYVQHNGVEWVCLAGDSEIIPDRDCYMSYETTLDLSLIHISEPTRPY